MEMIFNEVKKQLTKEEYKLFVTKFKVKLPEDYKEHILKYNGGYPNYEFINDIRIHYFHTITHSDHSLENILEKLEHVLPKDFFPIAKDEGGNHICISLKQETYGEIYIWYHDMDENKELEFLARDFNSLMNNLTEEPVS